MEEKLTLLQLQEMIQEGVSEIFPQSLQLVSEVSSVKENASGHCYLELVEWQEGGRGPAAKARAMIWSSAYRIIKPLFKSATGRDIEVGMHLLMRVQPQYSPLYGLSLIISDIDPLFTVGEMELARQRTIERLQKEGLMEMNALLPLPLLPSRIAIVSSPTAAGYADFMNHLQENQLGVNFLTELFVAPMQGDEAPDGIIAALERIAQRQEEFDLVVLIRGGGAVTDLISFDNYDLAVNIANFPLPVITGVGHETDYHICDMVAHTGLKTPTAVADFLLDAFAREREALESMATRIANLLMLKIKEQNRNLDIMKERMRFALRGRVERELGRLGLMEAALKSAIPEEVLSKGFAMLYSNGSRVRSLAGIEEGQRIEIAMSDGVLRLRATEVEFIPLKKS